MYLVKWIYFNAEAGHFSFSLIENNFDLIEELNFALLVLSLTLVAAAGYIINDVFDEKEDSVNKPNKQIIGIHVSPESAKKVYWIMNVVSLIVALYLSFYFQKSTLAIFIFVLIGLLWWYSSKLKKKFLAGNILIGLITASTALITASFLQGFIEMTVAENTIDDIWINTNEQFLWSISSFIFILIALLTIPREIIKDIQDMEGDKTFKAKTVPIVSGIFPAKVISVAILFLYLGPFFYLADFPQNLIIIIPIVLTMTLILISNSKKMFAMSSLAMKINMLIGMLFIIYISISNN